MQYCSVLLLTGFLVINSCIAAPQAREPSSAAPAAPPNVMALGATHPDINMAIKAVKNNDADLAAYLSDPKSVCTFFAPTDKAMQEWMKLFGKYAGKAVQNVTFMHSALNYHVIPGKALTAADLAQGGRALTRANETVYFAKQGGQPKVYSRHDYPIGFKQTDVKAGNCVVHKINMALAPPTSANMVKAWVDEIGKMPKAPPASEWAPQQQPLPNSREAMASAAPPAAAAGASTPGGHTSSSASVAPVATSSALLIGMAAVAAVMLL